MSIRTVHDGWERFARLWVRASKWFGSLTLAAILVVRLTSRWPLWDTLDPWTVWVPTALGATAAFGLVLAVWARVVHPARSRTRWVAAVGLFAMVPAAYVSEWSDRHSGFGAIQIVASVVMATGLVVLFLAALGTPVRGVVAAIDRRRRSRELPTLSEAFERWLRAKRRPQQLAVLLVGTSASWLLVASFVPPPTRHFGGAMGAFVQLLSRLTVVASDLAIGVAAGGVVMWFQEDRLWADRPGSSGHRRRRRWASAQ